MAEVPEVFDGVPPAPGPLSLFAEKGVHYIWLKATARDLTEQARSLFPEASVRVEISLTEPLPKI